VRTDPADRAALAALFAQHRFVVVVHLAAQAGVRHSIDHPHAYVDANLEGFSNVLEGCRHNGCRHLLYASSSSVYGANTKVPFSIDDKTDHLVNFYAATKKANEMMAYSYSHLSPSGHRLCISSITFSLSTAPRARGRGSTISATGIRENIGKWSRFWRASWVARR
jgi:UDP-glucuronate 4-epimerase